MTEQGAARDERTASRGRAGRAARPVDEVATGESRREDREALEDVAREFTRREVTPYLQEWEDAGEVPRALHRAAAKQGLLGIAFPEDVGGEGGDLLDSIAVHGGDVRGGGVERADGRPVHLRHRPAPPGSVAATPTWSTGSSAPPWPAS